MNILLVNDDGIHARGINVLAEHLQLLGNLWIVAPDRNRSGASNSLSLERPVRIRQINNKRYSVAGTPTDCTHIALTGLLDVKFDLVVSGINDGSNLADDVLYSGTVAAALEARLLGIPAIAVSLANWDTEEKEKRYFETAAIFISKLIEKIELDELEKFTLLNVNVPNIPYDRLNGVAATRLGTRHRTEPTIKALDPRGSVIYWIGPPGAGQDIGPGTDFDAISNNKVSITSINLDNTNHKDLKNLKSMVKSLKGSI